MQIAALYHQLKQTYCNKPENKNSKKDRFVKKKNQFLGVTEIILIIMTILQLYVSSPWWACHVPIQRVDQQTIGQLWQIRIYSEGSKK